MLNSGEWKRISIEAVVIVGSILLAFAIDAAWESRKDHKLELDLLRAISADMQNNLNHLNEVIESHARALEGTNIFINSTPAQLAQMQTGGYRTGPKAIMYRQTYTPSTGSLQNLNLSTISDATLRNAVGLWIGQSEEVREETPRIEDNMIRMRHIGGPYGIPLSENILRGLISDNSPEGSPSINDIFSKLREDEQFVETLLIVNIGRSGAKAEAERLRTTTEEVLRLLNKWDL